MSDKNLPSPLFAPRTFQEAREFAAFVAKTNFVPKDYKDKPDEILACIQYGSEVGLSPMQALQSIAVINGRPSLFGDASLALVMASGLLEYIKETTTPDGNTAICEVKRKGDVEPHIVKWSAADTQTAGLANGNVHKSYPKRMRQMRARGFCLRDKFADVLRGLISEDEAIDVTPPKEDGELSPDETPRARDKVTRDDDALQASADLARQDWVEGKQRDEADREGASLESGGSPSGDTPVTTGDYPTAEEVLDAFKNYPNAAKAMEIIRSKVPDFGKRADGIASFTPQELKALMEGLRQ